MPSRYAKAAPNAARVAQKRHAVSLPQHFLTGKQRPCPTQHLSYTWQDLDRKTFDQFSATLNADSCCALAAPAVGISQHMQLLASSREELLPFVEAQILGKGVERFAAVLETHTSTFNVLNSFSDTGGPRDETSIRNALGKADALFTKMHAKEDWKELIVLMRQSGVRLMHYAQAFQDCVHFFGNDAGTTARSIPPHQPCQDRLKEAADSSQGSPNAKPRLLSWLAKALTEKNSEYAGNARVAAGPTRNFGNIGLDDNDEDDGQVPSPVPSPRHRSPLRRSPLRRSRSPTPTNVGAKSKAKAKAKGRARSLSPLRCSVTPPARDPQTRRADKAAKPDPMAQMLQMMTAISDRLSAVENSSQQRMPSLSQRMEPLASQIPQSQVSNLHGDVEGLTQQEDQEFEEPPATQRRSKRSRREPEEEEDEAPPTQKRSRKDKR